MLLQEEGWVVCRAFKKKATAQTKTTIEGWDTSYFYEEVNGVSTVVDPIDLISRQSQSFLSQNFMCKQELEAENLNCMHHHIQDPFVQLPQLESPSLPLVKRPSTMSLASSDNNNENEDIRNKLSSSNNTTNKVTDWRALDKFVASQLSQEDMHETNALSSFEPHNNNHDMALLLLQSSRDEGNKLSPFLNTSSDCDIGIYVFEK